MGEARRVERAILPGVPCNTGIPLHNITASQLQDSVDIRKTTGSDGKGIVFFLPQSLIDNTMAAFNVGGKTPADLDPTKPYLGPAAAGQLGWRGMLYQNWNRFFDASIVKRTRIRETMNVEFRATALNVFNYTNFGTGAGDLVEGGQPVDEERRARRASRRPTATVPLRVKIGPPCFMKGFSDGERQLLSILKSRRGSSGTYGPDLELGSRRVKERNGLAMRYMTIVLAFAIHFGFDQHTHTIQDLQIADRSETFATSGKPVVLGRRGSKGSHSAWVLTGTPSGCT